jgi:hypothetical protein
MTLPGHRHWPVLTWSQPISRQDRNEDDLWERLQPRRAADGRGGKLFKTLPLSAACRVATGVDSRITAETFFPEHRDKRLYGILAAVDLSPETRARALREGLYVARIQDQVFALDVPEDFQPQAY